MRNLHNLHLSKRLSKTMRLYAICVAMAMLLVAGTPLMAQQTTLMGMTTSGGIDLGTIFKYSPGATSFKAVYNLPGIFGALPAYTIPLLASDGKLYGMAGSGGRYNVGVIFQYDPATGVYIKKFDFDNTNGGVPQGSLVQASDGKLYGMTYSGGASSVGVLFQYDPATNTYTKKLDFDNTNGSNPFGSLVQASDGKLYSMTSGGGSVGAGVMFQYDPATDTFVKKFDFDFTNGASPVGSLMQADDGKLYGMTSDGGATNDGVIFQYDPTTDSYTKKFDFSSSNGIFPVNSLVQAGDGKLYGMTPLGGLNDVGVLFQYDPAADAYSKKIDFDSTNGSYTYSGLVQTSNGKLYGMTANGGATNYGLIFQYDPATNTYVKEIDFQTDNGSHPTGGLVQTSNGKLYGMTYDGGGAGNLGCIFQYDLATNTTIKKITFFGSNGSNPKGSLVQASNGKLYGMTTTGGANDLGVLFQYDPVTGTYIKKIDFNSTIGSTPFGSLLQASDGKLYGMTSGGGTYNAGVLFQYNPATGTYTKKVDFNVTNGAYPRGSLMQASDGKLYGVTLFGGVNSNGVLFQYNPATHAFVKKIDFDDTNGSHPFGSLVQANDGKLYGVTEDGGTNSVGVIFQYIPATNTYTKKADFDGTNGAFADGSLVQADDGKLYGMTTRGGKLDYGVLFQYDPAASTLSKMVDLDTTTGYFPVLSHLIKVVCSTITAGGPTTFCAGDSVMLTASSGGSYVWSNGATTQSINVKAAGSYTVEVDGFASCDAITVTFIATTTSSETLTSCDSLAWNGNTYYSSGDYDYHTSGIHSCDSIATLHLTINHSVALDSLVAYGNPLCPGSMDAVVVAVNVSGTNAVVDWYKKEANGTRTYIHTGGSVGGIGAGTYIAVVSGLCGNPVEDSIDLIEDTTKPTITCPGDKITSNGGSCTQSLYTDPPVFSGCGIASLTWNLSGATVASSQTKGFKFVGRKDFNNGITTVTYTIKDNSNNTNSCAFTINVKNNVKPDFVTTNTNIVENVVAGCSKTITVPDVTFSDNCGTPQLSWTMRGATVDSGNGQIGSMDFNVGSTKIKYKLQDANGNIRTSSFSVNIKDTIAPSITCSGNITSDVGKQCRVWVNIPDVVISANCSVKSLSWAITGATTRSSLLTGIRQVKNELFNAGTSTVTYTVTDVSGNTNTCSLQVTLNSECSTIQAVSKSIETKEVKTSGLKVNLSPNPTASVFTLQVQSDSRDVVEISVYNSDGKKIQQLKTAHLQSIIFGEKYVSGSYLIEVRQGEKRATVVGVKQ